MTIKYKPVVETDHTDGTGKSAKEIWTSVKYEMKATTSASLYSKWIKELQFVAEVEGGIQLAADSAFQRDRVRQDYLRDINRRWSAHDVKKRRVSVACFSDISDDVLSLANMGSEVLPTSVEHQQVQATPDVVVEDDTSEDEGSHIDRLTFDNLITGETNRVAATVARRIAEDAGAPAQSVYFYGRHGVGKTHLLLAVAAEMARRSDSRKAVYMSAEEFMVAFVEGVKQKDTSSLKSKLRSADVLLIDDLQAIAGMGGTQKEFFSNIRAVVARGGQVIITADVSPSQMSSLNQHVRQELQGGVTIEVGEPDEEMRRRIVRVKAAELAHQYPEFSLEDDAIDLIVSRVRGPGRQLYGAVCNVFTATAFIGNPVTMDDVHAAIRRQLGDRKPPTIDQVKRAVMAVFEVTKTDLESARRSRSIAYPRQIAMYICRKQTTRSLPQIGRYFGDRDHTTVLYAVRKLEGLITKDASLKSDIDRVESALEDVQAGAN